MHSDHDSTYLVFKARDARFDGRLFVGVTSTGVYCRPVCRVRTPRRENCRFFNSPAQAEAATFRPCLKCRPEMAPGPALPWSVMDASRTLAIQAARWLDGHAADATGATVAALALHLGVSDRHVRRIFSAEHGVTPVQYLQTQRLLLAKQLLTDSRLPIAQVALASGFRSVRRFNGAFADSYRMSPTRLRGDGPTASDAPIDVLLSYRPPCDSASLLRFLAQRAIPGIEGVDGATIRRTVRAGVLGATAGWLQVEFLPDRATRAPQVRVSFAPSLARCSGALLARVRRWLDLDADPDSIASVLTDLPGEAGLRLPGSVDVFEMAVRAVLGQQVTVAAARTLARRLVERFGAPLVTPWPGIDRLFPAPEVLAAVPLEAIGPGPSSRSPKAGRICKPSSIGATAPTA